MRVNSAVYAALAHNGHPCSGRRLHGLGNIRKEYEQKVPDEKRAQRIRGIACGDSFRRGRFWRTTGGVFYGSQPATVSLVGKEEAGTEDKRHRLR